jgi:hypothetical protein
VRQEIWQSLLSMLRVYAYAAGLSQGEITVTEHAPHAALLEHKGRSLVLTLNPLSGKGSCLQPSAQNIPGDIDAGEFEILGDGRLRAAGIERQLDEAAIDWVERLTRVAT